MKSFHMPTEDGAKETYMRNLTSVYIMSRHPITSMSLADKGSTDLISERIDWSRMDMTPTKQRNK